MFNKKLKEEKTKNKKLECEKILLKENLDWERNQRKSQREEIDELRLLVATICDIYNIDSISVSNDDKERLQGKFSIEAKRYQETSYKININKKVGRPRKSVK